MNYTAEAKEYKTYIIDPACERIKMRSDAATNLLLGTCAQESHLGKYFHQIEGPALGIFQMEPATYEDIMDNYLNRRKDIYDRLATGIKFDLTPGISSLKCIIHNLWFASAMCRIHYYRVKEPLPAYDDIEGLAYYWKTYYNTKYGKGTPTEFVENFKRLVINE